MAVRCKINGNQPNLRPTTTPTNQQPAYTKTPPLLTYLRQCTCPVILDFVVAQIQLPQHLALSSAQTPAKNDGTIVAQTIATQVKLQGAQQ
jgi:hypothetical protein